MIKFHMKNIASQMSSEIHISSKISVCVCVCVCVCGERENTNICVHISPVLI